MVGFLINRHAYAYYVLLLCFGQSHCYDYCKVSCDDGSHTMCKYSNKLGSGCKEFDSEASTLSRSEKEEILDAHNKLRSTVANGKEMRSPDGSPQPPAADMMELVWNAELEEIATRWARQCIYEHDKCRKTENGDFYGQNLAIDTRVNSPHSRPVDSWFGEVKDFDKASIAKFGSSSGGAVTGHYTQGVWAATRRIGCAKAVFYYADFSRISRMVVCNYGPGGNMLGDKIYTEGKACSACPDGLACSSKYSGLCANPEKSSFAKTAIVKFNLGLTLLLTLLSILSGFMCGGSLW